MLKIIIQEIFIMCIGLFLMFSSTKYSVASSAISANNNVFTTVSAFLFMLGALIFIFGKVTQVIYSKNHSAKMKRKKGADGEKDVQYNLNSLNKTNFAVLNSLVLFDPNNRKYNQEFDSLVIGKNAIFNIETKAYVGNIRIDKEDNWNREKHNKVETLQSPAIQAKRHRKLLETIVGKNINIVDIIVLADSKTTVNGIENCPVKILRLDNLAHYIENYHGHSSNNINDIKNKILKHKTQRDTSKYNKSNTNPLFYWYLAIKVLISAVLMFNLINPGFIPL